MGEGQTPPVGHLQGAAQRVGAAAHTSHHIPRAEELDARKIIRFGALADLADQASMRHLGTGFQLCDCKTLVLHPAPAQALDITVFEIGRSGDRPVVEARITDQTGSVLAVMALTFEPVPIDTAVPPETPQPAKHDETTLPAIPDTSLRQRRLDHLLAAATRVIAEKGFASATTREIASAAGIHVPTLYRYVASKEELLELVYRRELAHAVQALNEGVDHTAPNTDQLRQVIANHIHLSDTRRQEIGILNREFKHLAPAARAEMVQTYRKLLGRFERVLRNGIDAGDFRPMDAFIAANFLDVAGDIWSLRQFFFDDVPLKEFERNVTDFLIAAVCKDP